MFLSQITQKKSFIFWLSLFLMLSILSVLLSLWIGSVPISWHLVHLSGHSAPLVDQVIVFKLRLPRALCAFVTGGMLALAGALMQTLLRNPLADPYVLGASGGAAVAALLALLFSIPLHSLGLWAFVGSLFSMFLVISLARKQGLASPLHLLLTGVVVATGWGALISFILIISPQQNLKGMLFWLMGDLSYAQFSGWDFGLLVVALVVSWFLAKPLNMLYRGDLAARALGVNTKRLRFFLYLVSSLLTACAVSMAGCIGFVGLIVPHILRLLVSSDHRFLLPASVLLGGSLLTFSDALARTVLSPVQLPVGIVMVMIGVPTLLFLLKRSCRV